ncbi:MAG: nucleotidyltransferase domain-containing protein [Flavobacteriaceae bacterium]|jgi:predicted nucleotidyltransferase|nr:nucleotidyltransferase domain-containing protein [Flavobacteriaceae bacterium]
MDKRETIIEKAKAYKDLVLANFPIRIEQFWLYGSYAKNQAQKDSDIDIALVVNSLDDNYNFFETEPILWTLTRKIDTRIEPVLIARDTDYAGFLDEIKSTGIQIQ